MRLSLLLLIVPLALLALALAGLLAPALRWAFRLSVAAALAFVVMLVQPGAVWLPLAVFAGTALLLSVGGRSDPEPRPAPASAAPSLDLGPAWATLREQVDWRTRRRLDAAAAACARYMALAETQEEPSAQLPIKIARHLPQMVADCVRHGRTATPDERRVLVADTLAALEEVAGRAEERRRALAHDAQRDFRARRAHLGKAED